MFSFFLLGCPASRPMVVPPGGAAVISEVPAGESAQNDAKGTLPEDSKVRSAGSSCFSGDQCLSGICEGASCDKSSPGTCVAGKRDCSAESVRYCGCDNQTFLASSTCPEESFSHLGPCKNTDGEKKGAADDSP